MKQASVVASLVCILINTLLLNFANIIQCNGSKENTIMYEIPSDNLKRFIFTDCQSMETANINCKCEDLGRDCENNDTKTCENCRCLKRSDKYRIFYIKKRNRAVCLSTGNLLKAAGFGEAFLFYNPPGNVSATINITDLSAYPSPYDPNDQLQMWVWTPGDLLMNVGTLKCLQVEGKVKEYRTIFVSRCDTSIYEQKWHCNEKLWFGVSSQKDSTRLTHAMRYQRRQPSLLARTVLRNDRGNLWTIYPKTNKTVCAARSYEGYFFLNRMKPIRISQIDLLAKCPKSGCLRRVYNSSNARNLTSCQILWEESSWLDVDTEMSIFFNKTRPSFTFKNYENEIYFEWKSNPYSSLAGTLVNLTIQCFSLNNKFRKFSFHVKIKDVVYETITGCYQFIQLKNQSLSTEGPNVPLLNLSNGCHDSVCSRQIDAPLKINKSNAVCIILGEESTVMRNGSSSMNLATLTELFSLNNVNKSLRLQWKPTSNSLLNKTIFNLTIVCYDDQYENQTIAEKSYLIFQTISNPDEKKPTSKKSADLLLEIILLATFLFILLVVLLVVFCCCYRRRRRRFPKGAKHSSSAANLQDNIGNQYPMDDSGTRSAEENDNPCYQEYSGVTSNPAVTIARNRLYETTTVFKQSRPDSEIYEKPVDSVKLQKKVFEMNKPTNSPKTVRHPSPSLGERRKIDLMKAKFEQTNPQDEDDDEIYDEPLRFIPGKSEYDKLNVGNASVSSNKLSSPYTKQSSTSPEQDDVTYDYVTREDIRTGLSKYPRQYPAEKPFEMTIDKETPYDPPLYATIDHDNGQN